MQLALPGHTILINVQLVELSVAVRETEWDRLLGCRCPAAHLRDSELQPVRENNLRPVFTPGHRVPDRFGPGLKQSRRSSRSRPALDIGLELDLRDDWLQRAGGHRVVDSPVEVQVIGFFVVHDLADRLSLVGGRGLVEHQLLGAVPLVYRSRKPAEQCEHRPGKRCIAMEA